MRRRSHFVAGSGGSFRLVYHAIVRRRIRKVFADLSRGAWDESLRRTADDRTALEALARDASVDLAARIPHGTGQTYLRELLLVIDHTAYHLGELIVVRRLLGAWPR